jgi:hypothetical protein
VIGAVQRLPEEAGLPPLGKLRLAGEIVAAYGVARWTLRRDGLRGALEALRSASHTQRPARRSREPTDAGRRLGRAVARTLGVMPADSRCLMCSLVLTRLLARRGIESRLVISVRPGDRFAAHAWVEHDGVALLAADAPPSERLVTL